MPREINDNGRMTLSELTTLTIIVLNYNGERYLDDCFASLKALDYPADRLEFMMVDNGSSDDSLEFMRDRYPDVRVVRSETNVGFAAGNNLGAREATGEHVIFLNNDMRVTPEFARALVSALDPDEKLVCAAAKILSWDGKCIDFAGSAGHFAGYAYQVGVGDPVSSAESMEQKQILFPCGGAMIVDRQVFLDVGGFDEDFFFYYEDFDLGWRLWVLGYQVLFVPDAVAYHHHHGTTRKFPDYRQQFLFKRNSLYAAMKNYEDANLAKALPAILLGHSHSVVEQAARKGGIDPSDFLTKDESRSSAPHVKIDKGTAGSLLAMYDVVEDLPALLEKRHFIQENRQRSDAEVLALFKRPFRYWPGVDPQTQYRLLDAFDVQELFDHLPRRVLVISSDILPYPGMPTVGSGLRAWGIGQGLKSMGHEVVFSMPRAALVGRKEIAPPEAVDLAWENHTLGAVVRAADPDVVVVCNWPVMALVPTETLSIPVILDQHGPHYLEREYQKAGDSKANAEAKLTAMRKADFFTCAGEKQWHYFQSWLERAGWTPEERRERSAFMPVSLSGDLPERSPADELTFVYGGVFLPWQDPTTGLFALIDEMESREEGKLYFFGGKHPVYTVDTGIFESLLAQLEKSDHVITPGMVSHDELIDTYTQAHVAIDLMKRNPERELAFTTRTVEYLWCGLPVIYNDYSELSEYIREYEAGWVVDPEDEGAVRRVLAEIFEHPEEVAARSRNAQRLVRERLNWSHTVAPLDRFVRHPRMRPHEYGRRVPAPVRNLRYLLGEARLHYRRAGFGGLWRESWSFLKRQLSF